MQDKLLNFARFKKIMEIIIKHKEQKERIEKFVEKEIADSSFFLITFGEEIGQTLINMLADEFNCWFEYSKDKSKEWWECGINPDKDNDISYWFYEFLDDKQKTIEIDNQEIDITTIDKFYNYLTSENKI